jgi:hypothetical protein
MQVTPGSLLSGLHSQKPLQLQLAGADTSTPLHNGTGYTVVIASTINMQRGKESLVEMEQPQQESILL